MWDIRFLDNDLFSIFYNFIIYGFFGWIYESCYVSVKKGEVVNRGFLNGPIIPIYGLGATIVIVTLSSFEDQIVLVFFGGMILASILEYLTSFLMEKLFHAKWWDYSDLKYNLKGRICLRSSIFWGFLSVLAVKVLTPFSDTLIEYISRRSGEYAAYVILAVFITDLLVTVVSTMQLDKKLTIMSKLREEFKEYIASTRLYEATEEVYEKYAESQISDIIDKFKDKLENNIERIEALELKDKKDDIYEKLKAFTSRYQKTVEHKNLVHFRILKAFPDFKAINKEGALKDLKARLHIRKKR